MTLDLDAHLPPVNCQYGAPMGRRLRPHSVAKGRNAWEEDLDPCRRIRQEGKERRFEGVVSLRKVDLDSGGYDRGGAYWGHGAPIWSALSECGVIDMIVRAPTREAAKNMIREKAPKARFYR